VFHLNTVFAVMAELPNQTDSLSCLVRACDVMRETPSLRNMRNNSGDWEEPAIPRRLASQYWNEIADNYRPREYREPHHV
jgi:hypothetical protein